MTSTSQLPSVPNSTVDVPIRPYTAAEGAAAISRAKVADVFGGDAAVGGDGLRVRTRSPARERRRGR